MSNLRKAAQQALDALEPYADIKPRDWKTDREKLWRAYDDLRAALALAQPTQAGAEPVAWMYTDRFGEKQAFTTEPPPSFKASCQALYTHPPARVPLTDEQIGAAINAWFEYDIVAGQRSFAERMRSAIEAAHGIGGGK